MKASSMYLLSLGANLIKENLPALTDADSPSKASVILNDLQITLTVPELEDLYLSDDKLLFLIRAIGVRIYLSIESIDWWYYNRYLKNNNLEK